MRPPDWTSEDGSVQLYCADCLDILREMESNSIDMIFTDPPYGHNNNNGDLIHNWEAALKKGPSGESRAIANDGREANEIVQVLFQESSRLLRHGGCCCCCCCCGGGGPDPQFARWSLWMEEHLAFKQMIVWDKGPIGMGWHYRRSYETVLVGMKPGGACKWYDDSQKIENIIRPGYYGIRKIIPSKDQHPTEKPIELGMHFMRIHSLPDDVVLDPFMGHGTTGSGAVSLSRKFIGIELDRGFFEIAKRRIQKAFDDQALLNYVAPEPKQQEMFEETA